MTANFWTPDQVPGPPINLPILASDVNYKPTDYPVASTLASLQNILAESVHADNFGLVPNLGVNLTTQFNAAAAALSALFLLDGIPRRLVFRPGTYRMLNALPMPGVWYACEGGYAEFKTVDNLTTYGDFRCTFFQNANTATWEAVPARYRDQDLVRLENIIIDGNREAVSQWDQTIVRFRIPDRGTGYVNLPSVVATGIGGSFTYVVGLGAEAASITAPGTNYIVGDEFVGNAGGGVILDNLNPVRFRVTAVDGGGGITAFEISEPGVYTTLPTGAIAQAAVVSYDTRVAVSRTPAPAGATFTISSYKLMNVGIGSSTTGTLFADRQTAVFTVLGGGGSTVQIYPIWDGTFNKIGGTARTEHNTGFYFRHNGLSYKVKMHFQNSILRNCQGDGMTFGGCIDMTTDGLITENCFRGGLTVTGSGDFTGTNVRCLGEGNSIHVEVSQGSGVLLNPRRFSRAGSITTGGGAAGTGYVVGDILQPVVTTTCVNPAQFLVLQVGGSGEIIGLQLLEGGDYETIVDATVSLIGGAGTGAIMTVITGDERNTFTLSDFICDTDASDNQLQPESTYSFSNGKWKYRRMSFADRGSSVVNISNLEFEGTDRSLHFAGLMPQYLSMSNVKITRSDEIGNVVFVNTDSRRDSCLAFQASSGGFSEYQRRAFLDNVTLLGLSNCRNQQFVGIRFIGSTTPNTIRVKDRICVQMTNMLYERGLQTGVAHSGGLHVISVAPIFNCPIGYAWSADSLTQSTLENRGGFTRLKGCVFPYSLSINGAPFGVSYVGFDRTPVREEDNLFAPVAVGFGFATTAYVTGGARLIVSANTPALATNKGGFSGDIWEVRPPVANQINRYIGTVNSRTDAVWVPLAGEFIRATATYNPPSLAVGTSDTIKTLAVTGAVVGQRVEADFGVSSNGLNLRAYVSAADTVSYYAENPSANPNGTQDLASSTCVFKVYPST